jgi:hypothetical protein
MMVIQDTPANSDTAASHSASSSTVAPSGPRAVSRLSRIMAPNTPPAVFGYDSAVKWSVAKPQLVTNVSTKPAARNARVAREAASHFRCCSR